jgi:hypothetical protein
MMALFLGRDVPSMTQKLQYKMIRTTTLVFLPILVSFGLVVSEKNKKNEI